MEKQMETLTTILQELRNEQRGIQEEGMRSGRVTPGHVNKRNNGTAMRGRTTKRFGGKVRDQSLRRGSHEGGDQSPGRQSSNNNDRTVNAEERELRQQLHNIEQERDQIAARNHSRAKQLEEEVRRLAQIINDMQGQSRAPGWRIMLDGESPISLEMINLVIPRDFRFPDLKYSGRTDSFVNIERFNDITGVHGLSEAQRCRVFPLSLEGRAREWYRKLSWESIRTFEQMCQKFTEYFQGAMAPEDDIMELATMKQRDDETLREFIKRYYRVVFDLGAFNYPQALRELKE